MHFFVLNDKRLSVTPGVIGFLFMSLASFNNSFGQTDCELRKSEGDILVYACNTSNSKLKSIRATFSIETTPSVLAGHLLDVKHYNTWQYRTFETQVLKQVSENEIIYRGEVDAPWPVSNRDLIVRLTITQDPATKVMRFSIISIPDYMPKKPGVVRVPLSEGFWVVTPAGPNKLNVEYSFLVDPGGSIPAWLINLTIAEGPLKTFQTLKERIKTGVPVKPAAFIRD